MDIGTRCIFYPGRQFIKEHFDEGNSDVVAFAMFMKISSWV